MGHVSAELYIIVLGVIAVFVLGMVVAIREKKSQGASRPTIPPLEGHIGFRRAAITVAEIGAVVQLLTLLVLGAVYGGSLGLILRQLGVGELGPVLGVLLGGLIGFVIGSFALGVVFCLSAIERNTRAMAMYAAKQKM